jgi:hypothetical protein
MARLLAVFPTVMLAGAAISDPSIAGRVERTGPGAIAVRSSSGKTAVFDTDSNSKVRRGRAETPLSSVHEGEEVLVTFRRRARGRPIVTGIYTDIDHASGRIAAVRRNRFDVDENFNADPRSAYPRQRRPIVFDSATQFELSAARDLRPGRTVDVIGFRTGGPELHASRIVVYDGNKPVRMRAGRPAIRPDGSVSQ